MPRADRPSGPGKPLKERREAATEQEELDELAAEAAGEPVDTPAEGAAAAARHAERAAHTREAAAFAQRVAERLAEGHRQGRYDTLRLVAEARFLGLLRKALSPEVAAAVQDEIDSDLVHADRRTLTERPFPRPR